MEITCMQAHLAGEESGSRLGVEEVGCNFERDAIMHRKPMERFHPWSDMYPSDSSGQRALNQRQLVDCSHWCIVQQRVAVINA